MNKLLKKLIFLPRLLLMWFISLYQKTLSPDHGPIKHFYPQGYCKYYPTCSQYGYEVIQKRGVFVGSVKAVWRILRCNPWSKGGIDLPS